MQRRTSLTEEQFAAFLSPKVHVVVFLSSTLASCLSATLVPAWLSMQPPHAQDASTHGGLAQGKGFSNSKYPGSEHTAAGSNKPGGGSFAATSPIQYNNRKLSKVPSDWDLDLSAPATVKEERCIASSGPAARMHACMLMTLLGDPYEATNDEPCCLAAALRRHSYSILGLPLISPLARPYKVWASCILMLDLVYTAFLIPILVGFEVPDVGWGWGCIINLVAGVCSAAVVRAALLSSSRILCFTLSPDNNLQDRASCCAWQ